jgi:4-amino-4-deoxy-L-arabinose transferase-like glycosyltransferase
VDHLDLAHDGRDVVVAPAPRGRLSDPWVRALAVTLAAGALRLVVAAFTPLFPDETYYWEYSRHLAAGYFDHPPLVAFAVKGGTVLFGATPLGVRFVPIVLGTIGALFLAATARRVAGDVAALWLAVAFAAMPLAAGLVLATPDAPLLAASCATLYCVVRALQADVGTRATLAWWCVAGIALGLAVSSKYTAVLLPLGIFAGLLASPLRARLATPGPYVATAVALVIFSPVVLWNAANDWISFAFQLSHGLGGVSGSPLKRELELLGGQMGLLTPILFVLCAIAVGRGIGKPLTPLHRVLAVTAALVFAFFVYSATKRRVEANWPALAYLPALVLAVAYLDSTRWKKWFRGGTWFAGVLSAVVYVNAFVPVLPVPARRDPAARASGWEELAAAVHRVHAPRLPISSYRTWVAADRYQDASELAFHLPDNPEVFSLNITGRPNTYDLWPSFNERADARDAMILVIDEVAGTHPTLAALTPHFEGVTRGEMVTLARNGDPVKYLRIWTLDRWRGSWPQ